MEETLYLGDHARIAVGQPSRNGVSALENLIERALSISLST
jgi:hypothetical protein